MEVGEMIVWMHILKLRDTTNLSDSDEDSNYEVGKTELYHGFSITSQSSPK